MPLLLLGLLEGFVGFNIYKKSDDDRIRNVYALKLNPGEFRNKEYPRMQKVNSIFMVLKWVEVTLIVTGVILYFFFRYRNKFHFWQGAGLALAIQAMLMQGADFFAEKRAHVYTKKIESFIENQ